MKLQERTIVRISGVQTQRELQLLAVVHTTWFYHVQSDVNKSWFSSPVRQEFFLPHISHTSHRIYPCSVITATPPVYVLTSLQHVKHRPHRYLTILSVILPIHLHWMIVNNKLK
jgi:hypothetical protein